MEQERLWTRNFVVISLASFFVAMVFYLLMTTMALFSVQEFQANQSQAGLASGVFVVGALGFRLLVGRYIELIGRKKVVYGSLFLFFLLSFLYWKVDNLQFLFLVRFIHGGAFGAANTAIQTIIIDNIPLAKRGEGIGYFSLSSTLATAIGPLLGIVLMQYCGFEMIFLACNILAMISIICLYLAQIKNVELNIEQRNSFKNLHWQDFFEEKALPISLIMFVMGIAFSGILTFINSYALSLNLALAAKFFFLIYAVFIIISRPFTGRLLDLKGDNFIMYPALFVYGISLFLLSEGYNDYLFLTAGALIGLGFGTVMSSSQVIATKKAPRHKIGLATATFFFALDFGVGIGPYFIGLLIPYIGFSGMYKLLSIIVIAMILAYHYLHGKSFKNITTK
ncbi:MAG: MFS transporter [Negativicutes bacterium]|nr:MFS transporter [Negativicutes bacterium]MBP9537568.1 MFS transporter [Negativicutes bacterium]MBP9949030.1 MFS transporter [Negativicutes bacterium]